MKRLEGNMENITSQLDAIRNADSLESLKASILEAFSFLNRINRIQETLSGVVNKIHSMEEVLSVYSSDTTIKKLNSDIISIKGDIARINEDLNTKANKSYANELNSKTRNAFLGELNKIRDDLNSKAELPVFNKLRNDLMNRVDEQDKKLSFKADISSLNTLAKDMATKADKSNVEMALSLKADISKVKLMPEKIVAPKKVEPPKAKVDMERIRMAKRSVPDKYITSSDLILGTYLAGDKISSPTTSGYRRVYPIGFSLDDNFELIVNTNELYQISFIGFNSDGICLSTSKTWLSDGTYNSDQIKENAGTINAKNYSFQVKRLDNNKLTEGVFSSDYFLIEKKNKKEKNNE